MRRLLLTIAIVGAAVAAQAQGADTRKQAAEMNQQAEAAMKVVRDHSVRDSVRFYHAVIEAVNNTLKCDEYDRMPIRNGVVKPRFESVNGKRLRELHARLLDAGRYLSANREVDEARTAYILYMNAAENRLLRGSRDLSGMAAYELAEISLERRNYKQADRYANMALAYDNSAQLAAEIKAQCMRAQMVTPQDSAKYLAVINKLYETDPNNEKYFAWIMQFYDRPQQRHRLEYFVDKELENNPNSIVPWILKGELAMKAERWEEAIEAYQYADEIDPSNIPVAFNIGVCLNNRVVEIQNSRRQEGKALSEDDDHEIKQLLAESRAYLERVKGRDPQRKKVDWLRPLYMVYTVLGEKIKADELEPLVNGFKQKN